MRFVILFRDRVIVLELARAALLPPCPNIETDVIHPRITASCTLWEYREYRDLHSYEGFEKDEWLPWVMNERNALSIVEYARRSDIRPRHVENDLDKGNKKTLLKGIEEI